MTERAFQVQSHLLQASYYLATRWLPPSTAPGGRLWRALRRITVTPLLAEAGASINVEYGAYIGDGSQISLGSRSSIGIRARIHGPAIIGSNVMMAPDVMVFALEHKHSDYTVPMIDQGYEPPQAVTIEDDVWIGARAILLPGVTVGHGSVVGAGAIVAKSVPPYSVVVGNPGRVVRDRVAGDGSE